MQEIHINKVPTSKHFAVTEIKQLLPIHQQTAIQNLRIIFKNYSQSSYPRHIFLFPDENLSLTQSNTNNKYTFLKAVWTQDFDSKPQHLKSSLTFACSLLNYLGSIDEDSPIQEQHTQDQNYIKKCQIFTVSKKDQIGRKNPKYSQIKQTKTFIGFKFQKIQNRIYMMIGLNIKTRQGFPLISAIFRQWNIGRLKINKLNLNDYQVCHRTCQHLFSIGRQFIRQVSDDYNTYRTNVQKLIQKLKNNQNPITQEQLTQAYQQCKLDSNNLAHQVTIIKWQVVFRNKNWKQNLLWELICQIVMEWLLQTPLNSSCSYSSIYFYDQTSQSISIIVASYYQIQNTFKQVDQNSISRVISEVQSLLFDEVYKKPLEQDGNPLRKSMMIMNKYQVTDKNQSVTQKLLANPPQQNSSSQLNNSMNNSLNNSLNNSMYNASMNESFISLLSGQSQNRKISMKDIAKLQNQIYQILKLINSKKPIIPPLQMQTKIRNYVRKFKNLQLNDGVTSEQFEVLQILDAINQQLTAQQVYIILNNNTNQSSLIFKFLMSRAKYSRSIQVGKMMIADKVNDLYKAALKSGLLLHKHTIIPMYLKRMLETYLQKQIPLQPLKVQQISIPQLVQMIEKKNFNSQQYFSILMIVFSQLFVNYQPAIRILAPLLYYCYQFLLNQDHHEQLVTSFIGDLLYQVCYFTSQTKMSSLNNNVYMEDKYSKILTIKQKKILQILRQGGFKGFGFEIKNQILSIINTNKNYNHVQDFIFHIIRVKKPQQLQLFFKFMSSCRYTLTINKIAKFLEHKNYYSDILSKNSPLICYVLQKNRLQNSQQKFQRPYNSGQRQQFQFDSIAERILRSQSGFFQDIVKLNPKIKIAGIELKTAMKNLIDSGVNKNDSSPKKQKLKGKINQQQVIKTYLSEQFKHTYQYVSLAWSLKQKYLRYPTLSENEKAYFRDCAMDVVDHKKQIVQYIQLSDKLKKISNQK